MIASRVTPFAYPNGAIVFPRRGHQFPTADYTGSHLFTGTRDSRPWGFSHAREGIKANGAEPRDRGPVPNWLPTHTAPLGWIGDGNPLLPQSYLCGNAYPPPVFSRAFVGPLTREPRNVRRPPAWHGQPTSASPLGWAEGLSY